MRPRPTLADFIVIAISPALIMALVGSLVFFLAEVFYQSQYQTRLQVVLAFFVMAAVLIGRISIEEGREYASLFALPLGIVTAIALMRFVEFQGVFAQFSWIINLGLIALIWWSADRLTWDCTVIDEKEDASGEGLMQTMGLDEPAAAAAEGDLEGTTSRDAEPTKTAGAQTLWQRILAARRRKHAPGVWVMYFSMAALPIFGIGQGFMFQQDLEGRRYTFKLLVVYVAAALGLLVTTSFLGLRRYLRQRRLEMPAQMAGAWIGTGAVMILGLLLFCMLLPRRNAEYSITHLPAFARAPENLQPSRWGFGNDGPQRDDAQRQRNDEQGKQASDQQGEAKQESADGKRQTPSQSGEQSKEQGSGQQQQKSDSQSSSQQGDKSKQQGKQGEKDQSQQGEKQEGKKGEKQEGKKGEKQEGKKGEKQEGKTGEKQDQQQSESAEKQDQNSSGSQGEQQRDQQSGQQRRDEQSEQQRREEQQRQQNEQREAQQQQEQQQQQQSQESSTAQQPPSSFSPSRMLDSLGAGIGGLLKLIYWLVAILLVGFFVWKYWAQVRDAIAKFIQNLRELWARLFGGQVVTTAAATPEPEAPPPPRPFADYDNPFQSGQAARVPLNQLIKYSFEAFEAWAREHGCPRSPQQTPHEFAQQVQVAAAGPVPDATQLAELYCRSAFGRDSLPANAARQLEEFWRQMQGAAAMTTR